MSFHILTTTWYQLAEAYPQLEMLIEQARDLGKYIVPVRGYCAHKVWQSHFQQAVGVLLAGRSQAEYDVVAATIIGALPTCWYDPDIPFFAQCECAQFRGEQFRKKWLREQQDGAK
jgi:hypothetical protein